MRIRSRGTRRVLRGSGTGENESKETGACRLWVSSWAKVSELSCETGSSVAEKAVTDRIVEYADSSEAGNRESSAVAGSFPFRPTSGFSDGWRLWVRSACAGSPDVPVAEYQSGGFNRGGVDLEDSGLPRAPSLVTGESDKGGRCCCLATKVGRGQQSRENRRRNLRRQRPLRRASLAPRNAT